MVVLGIVLIILAVLFGIGVAVTSTEPTTMQVFGVDFGVLVPTVFFLGAAAGAALIIGLWLTKKGLGRGYRRHQEVRALRQQVAEAPTTDPVPDTARTPEPGAPADPTPANTAARDTSQPAEPPVPARHAADADPLDPGPHQAR